MSNTYFNDEIHEIIGNVIGYLINSGGYDVVLAFQGGAYGGQFKIYDPNYEKLSCI